MPFARKSLCIFARNWCNRCKYNVRLWYLKHSPPLVTLSITPLPFSFPPLPPPRYFPPPLPPSPPRFFPPLPSPPVGPRRPKSGFQKKRWKFISFVGGPPGESFLSSAALRGSKFDQKRTPSTKHFFSWRAQNWMFFETECAENRKLNFKKKII